MAMNFPFRNGNLDDKIFARYRGKTAKEIYRFAKTVLITREVIKPAVYAAKQVAFESPSGMIISAAKNAGSYVICYVLGIGFAKSAYMILQDGKIKNITRIVYNLGSVPYRLYANGAESTLNLLCLDRFEEGWFGERVHICGSFSIWPEKNFTLGDAINHLGE
jgi:hypothetical protein